MKTRLSDSIGFLFALLLLLGCATSIQDLIKSLSNPESSVRVGVIEQLTKLGPEASGAADKLKELIQNVY
jgi:hypothetical protein